MCLSVAVAGLAARQASGGPTAYSAAYHIQQGTTAAKFADVADGVRQLAGLPADRFVDSARAASSLRPIAT